MILRIKRLVLPAEAVSGSVSKEQYLASKKPEVRRLYCVLPACCLLPPAAAACAAVPCLLLPLPLLPLRLRVAALILVSNPSCSPLNSCRCPCS